MPAPSDIGPEHGSAEQRMHVRAREHGISRGLYAFARVLVRVALHLWLRVEVHGAAHVPAAGAAIIAPNHKSMLDPFLVGIATRRHVRFMAKSEIFRGPLGPLVVRLGAFPVRRGEADAEALETARAILAAGGVVVVFPEGTRVDVPDALGSPHHGAGRLAVETGAPIVPAAIAGTSHLWLGPVPKPRRVRLSFLAPVRADGRGAIGETLAELIDRQVWPAVQQEYGRLAATPGPVITALAAAGVGRGILARRRRRAAVPRLLGVVPPRAVRRRARRGHRR